MGVDLPQDHDSRYAFAQEWWEIVKRLWTEPGRYDIDGRFWQLQGVESNPKPYDSLPPILNAGSSTQGRDFAARNSNVVFTVVGGPEDGAEIVNGSRPPPVIPTAGRSAYSPLPTASAARPAPRPRSSIAGMPRSTPTGMRSTI